MPKNYTITVSDEVEKALQKKATYDGITTQELLQGQLEYYISCALYDDFDPNVPINTPGLSIQDRLEVYAVGVNDGEAAARTKVTAILDSMQATPV